QVLNIEVLSERLGAPTYMYFVVRNAQTKQDIFESQPDNPPAEVVSTKFYARTDDPVPYRFTAPADGKYLLLVASRLGDSIAGPPAASAPPPPGRAPSTAPASRRTSPTSVSW